MSDINIDEIEGLRSLVKKLEQEKAFLQIRFLIMKKVMLKCSMPCKRKWLKCQGY